MGAATGMMDAGVWEGVPEGTAGSDGSTAGGCANPGSFFSQFSKASFRPVER